jgi:hypothetical protein
MAEEAKTNIEEMDVAGSEVQKVVLTIVRGPKVKRVTLFDKTGEVLLDIPVSDPAYKARAMRSVMPSMVNTLAIIGTKVPEIKVRVERE